MNWKEYLAQYDVVYEMPASVWQDGTPLGNGSLAALAYEPFHLEWAVNKNDVWDYRHPAYPYRHTLAEMRAMTAAGRDYAREMARENGPDVGRYPSPKTCGQVRLRFGLSSVFAPAHRVSKRLHLYAGTLETQLAKHLSEPKVTSFVCAGEDLLVIRVRDVSAMVAFRNQVDLYRVRDADMPDVIKGVDGDTLWLEQPFHDGFRFVMMARIVPTGGVANADLFRSTVDKIWWHTIEPSATVASRIEGEYAVAPVTGDFDVYVTVVTSREAQDCLATARQRLTNAVAKGSTALHQEHCRWWAEFWPKNQVGFDDPLLEQLWYVSQYNLATVLRGTPVGGLCGLWYGPMDTPSQMLPWMGNYTMDYNAQLPVMPVCRVNHPELADGTFRTVQGMLPGAQRNARDLYGLPGACYPCSGDPTGDEVGGGGYRFIHASGLFWCILIWRHYLYTRDTDYLRGVGYPVMREVARFMTSYLQWHPEEQLYHLEISQQPELMYVQHADPIYTMVLLKDTLHAVVEAAGILACDPELAEKCRHVLAHFPPYPRDGERLAPARGLTANHHNQFGTLQAVFPGDEFDPEIAPELREICQREFAEMDFWPRHYGCNRGHVIWNANFIYVNGPVAARLEMKEAAWFYLENLLKVNVKPSGLISTNGVVLANNALSRANLANVPQGETHHDHGPEMLQAIEVMSGRLYEGVTENLDLRDTICPALEGPALYLLLLAEMLLQSHNGILRLFPALPDGKNAEFADLRAEGPTLVTAQRNNGAVTFVRLKALAPVQWKLRNPWPAGPVWQRSSRTGEECVETLARHLMLTLEAGEEIILAGKREHLAGPRLLRPRCGEPAQARHLRFSDGMVTWVGKPKPSVYYASLEQARDAAAEPGT